MTPKEQALSLYKKVFYEDGEDFAKIFTDKYFDKCCRFLECDGKIASMLYLLDCTVFDGNKTYPAFYLYAAATDPDYRNKGLMSKLINSALAEDKLIITKPANDRLFGFYEKFGFTVCSFKDEIKKEFQKEETLDFEQYIILRKKLLKNIPHIILTDEEFSLDGFTLFGNGTYCAATDQNGEIKEYINGKVPQSKKPFAMWNKKTDISSLYFGIAMD